MDMYTMHICISYLYKRDLYSAKETCLFVDLHEYPSLQIFAYVWKCDTHNALDLHRSTCDGYVCCAYSHTHTHKTHTHTQTPSGCAWITFWENSLSQHTNILHYARIPIYITIYKCICRYMYIYKCRYIYIYKCICMYIYVYI